MRRKAALIPILLLPFITINSNRAEILVEKRIKVTKVVEDIPRNIKKLDIENNLIPAMIQVESLGNDSAIGDVHLIGNEAVGALQIRPIMIREVNRILKIQKLKKRFKRKDRYNRTKSIEMFMIWKEYHHPSGGFETIARNWNGGPRGYKNKRTERYWVKVQIELNN
tara:strand:- start:86 stop:586 length:501 start_codon:yes stop_codon:yes gene_type:complete